MSDAPTRVLCVDDNDLVAEAIEIHLRFEKDIQWIGRLPEADGLVEAVRAQSPDVVVLDLDMPGRDPFEALTELTATCPETRALIFSGHVRADLIDRAVEAGAWGYVSKTEGPAMMVEAVRRVARGEFVLDPAISADDRNG